MLKTRYPFVTKGSIGHAFASHTRTESPRKAGFCPFARPEVSVLGEPALGHLRYLLTDVPPQSNSPRGNVRGPDRLPLDRRGLTASSAPPGAHTTREGPTVPSDDGLGGPPTSRLRLGPESRRRGRSRPTLPSLADRVSRRTTQVPVFQGRRANAPPGYSTPCIFFDKTFAGVKLNRVFFPR